MFKCKYCNHTKDIKSFTCFVNPRRKSEYDPKYSFYIKSTCFNCLQYNGFLEQTPELMKELNGCVFFNKDEFHKTMEQQDELF